MVRVAAAHLFKMCWLHSWLVPCRILASAGKSLPVTVDRETVEKSPSPKSRVIPGRGIAIGLGGCGNWPGRR
jgi:hypothetical protein